MQRLIMCIAVAGTMTATMGCRTPVQDDTPERLERIASFEMAWAEAPADEIRDRAQAAAEVMTGRSITPPEIAVPEANNSVTDRRMAITVRDAPVLEIEYLPDYDELRLVDTELSASTRPDKEIGQADALALARRTFDALMERGAVPKGSYDWDAAEVASTWVGSGDVNGRDSAKRRIEYRVTVLRTLNGIPVANAGVRIAVHASGRVSALRLGGLTITATQDGEADEPGGRGVWLESKVALGDLKARFDREVAPEGADVRIAWERVMYVIPETERSAVVEPMYVLSYSDVFPSDEGESVVSRRKTVGFSLVDPGAPPVDLMPIVRVPEPDETQKQEP